METNHIAYTVKYLVVQCLVCSNENSLLRVCFVILAVVASFIFVIMRCRCSKHLVRVVRQIICHKHPIQMVGN